MQEWQRYATALEAQAASGEFGRDLDDTTVNTMTDEQKQQLAALQREAEAAFQEGGAKDTGAGDPSYFMLPPGTGPAVAAGTPFATAPGDAPGSPTQGGVHSLPGAGTSSPPGFLSRR